MTSISYAEKYNLFGGQSIEDDKGNYVAHLFTSRDGSEMLVFPNNGARIRKMAELTMAVAAANPDKQVGFDFSGLYIPVAPKGETVTGIAIYFDDNAPWGAIKPGRHLEITGESAGTVKATVKDEEANLDLFRVAIDAIRLSRANEGKPVEFQFNNHRLSVSGTDDAEEIERMLPERERVTNVRTYAAPPKREIPSKKVGGFTIRG